MIVSSIEKEKLKNQKFAEENNISSDEMETIYNEIFNSLPADMEEDKKTIRALRKTRGSLRRQVQSGNYVNGFLLMRFRNQDYNLWAWNEVDEFIKKNGLEKAKELKKVDDEGNYLHTKGFSAGEKIDKEAIFGSAIGIFEFEKDEPSARWVSIGQFNINDDIPLCQELNINIKVGKKPGPLFKDNLVYYNGSNKMGVDPMCTQDEMESYTEVITELFGDIIFDDISELKDYMSEHISDKNNFAGIHAICTQITTQKDTSSNIPIDFEFDDDEFTLWVRPEIFKGLAITEGDAGILFVNAYQGDDDIGFNVGGFLPYDDI